MTRGNGKTNWGFDIADIVAADHATNGHPRVSDHERLELIATLEEALMDRKCKQVLMQEVRRLCGGRFRHSAAYDNIWIERVLEGGLKVLDNEELALLLLNPVVVGRLYDELEDCASDHTEWREVMTRLGRQLMTAHGVTCPFPTVDFDEQAAVENSAAMPVGTLGPGGISPQRSPSIRLFEISPQDCTWSLGTAQSVGEPAIIEVEQLDENKYSVGLAGFLAPGKDVFVTIQWLSSAGEIISETAPRTPFHLKAVLQQPERCLAVGDWLIVHYRSGTQKTTQLQVRIDVLID